MILLVKLNPAIGRARAANIKDAIESIPDITKVEEYKDQNELIQGFCESCDHKPVVHLR